MSLYIDGLMHLSIENRKFFQMVLKSQHEKLPQLTNISTLVKYVYNTNGRKYLAGREETMLNI